MHRGTHLLLQVVLGGLLGLLLASCGKSSDTTATAVGASASRGCQQDSSISSAGPGTFTASLVSLDDLASVTPIGQMSFPSHLFPTEHTYFRLLATPSRHTVYAPGTGVIAQILDQPISIPSQKVWVRMTKTFCYHVDHVVLAAGLGVGTTLTAGQVLGTDDGPTTLHQVDFGVINADLTLPGFINPVRHAYSLHADSPLKYFAEPIKSVVYAKVDRAGSDKDGKIDFDQPGRLVGNWFHESTPSDGPGGEAQGLAFAYNVHNPAEVRIALGSKLVLPGLFAHQAGAPDPVTVTPASGKATYKLYWATGVEPVQSTQSGLLLIQMLDDNRVKAESFSGALESAEFTVNAQIFTR